MDTTKLGHTAAEIMETIENDEGLPENAQIEEVFIIASVTWPVADENASGHSTYFRCSSAFPWVQLGLLTEAERAVRKSGRPYEDDDA